MFALRTPIRNTQRRSRKRLGVFTVEFAVCSSVLFLSVFASLEFSRFMFARHSVDQAAFEAARIGVVIGNTRAQVEAAATNVLASAGLRNATVTVTPQTIDGNTTTVTVQVSCPFASNSWLPPRIFGTQPLVSSVTLDHENKAYTTTQVDVGNNNNEPSKNL